MIYVASVIVVVAVLSCLIATGFAVQNFLNANSESMKNHKIHWRSYQSVLMNIIIHLRILETEEIFNSYQIQDLFCSGLFIILKYDPEDFRDLCLEMNFKVFSPMIERRNFYRKFWQLLDMLAHIKIFEMKIKTIQVYTLDRFFSRSMSKILKKNYINTVQGLIDCDLYSLIYFSQSQEDISSFLAGFQNLYSHFYCLSKVDSSPTEESGFKNSVSRCRRNWFSKSESR